MHYSGLHDIQVFFEKAKNISGGWKLGTQNEDEEFLLG
jgi:hypothetical protein